MPNQNFKSLSDAIAEPLGKAYRAGGFGLAILTLGAILMLAAFFWDQPGPIRYVIVVIGAILTFFTLAYVYLKEFPRIKQARASVASNREMMDLVQQSAIQLTELVSDLQALAFKNANQIAEVIAIAKPLIRMIPVLGQTADSEAIVRADGLSRLIVSSTQNARKVILDLQQSLIEANPIYLKSHFEDLKHYKIEVQRMLASKD